MKRRVLTLVMAILMVFGITLNAAPYKFEAKDLFNQNARTFVEISKLEEYGLKVEEKSGSYTAKDEKVSLGFKANSNEIKVNDTVYTMDTKTILKDKQLFIPLRIVFETLNYKVDWDKNTNSITLQKQTEEKLPVTSGEYLVTKHHDKVVSIAPSVTEILFVLGAGDNVMGRSDYCNYPSEVEKVPSVGSMTEPSIEKIVALKPTVVIAQTHFKNEVLDKVKQANVEVLAMDTPSTMSQAYEHIKKIGTIIDKNYEARALISTMKAKQESVSRISKKLEMPGAYIVVGTGQYGEYTHGNSSFMNEILYVAGFKNSPQDADGFKYTLEKLIKLDPYYILSPSFAINDIKTGDAYKGLSAVKEGRVVEINADIFSRPAPRVVNEGIKELLKIAHPEVLKQLEF